MKIVFVGVHNKPYKTPLDSTTLSGRTIDAIIHNLIGFDCVKMNLFDVCYMPIQPSEKAELAQDFFNRAKLEKGDVVVCLGADVQKQISLELMRAGHLMVFVPHPSLMFSKTPRPDYIKQTTDKIYLKLIHAGFYSTSDKTTA